MMFKIPNLFSELLLIQIEHVIVLESSGQNIGMNNFVLFSQNLQSLDPKSKYRRIGQEWLT